MINEETYMPDEISDALWKRLLSECNFITLKNVIPKFLCMFGSMYVCEVLFSSVSAKIQVAKCIVTENLESELRCELNEIKPELSKISIHPSR